LAIPAKESLTFSEDSRGFKTISDGRAAALKNAAQQSDVLREVNDSYSDVVKRAKKLRAKDRPLANDFLPEKEFDRLLHAWFGNLARVLQPGGAFYLWGGYTNCAGSTANSPKKTRAGCWPFLSAGCTPSQACWSLDPPCCTLLVFETICSVSRRRRAVRSIKARTKEQSAKAM
jgi:hypothetical protein